MPAKKKRSDDRSPKALEAVAELFARNPDAPNSAFRAVAERADPTIAALGGRSFNAKYVLPFKRSAAAATGDHTAAREVAPRIIRRALGDSRQVPRDDPNYAGVTTDLSSYADLQRSVASAGDVLTVPMRVLRELADKDRLGPHVVKQISNDLASVGIHHYPRELPMYQDERVRLYTRGTRMADLLNAAVIPGEEQDAFLRQKLASDAEHVLTKIRALLS